MHPRQIVEAAALTAAHGRVFIRSTDRISISGMERYWSSSKCRLDHWMRRLKDSANDIQTVTAEEKQIVWLMLRPVIEEILTSEILTRVWAAVTAQYDRLRGVNEAEPMTRSILIGHMEARNRALSMMVSRQGMDVEDAVMINRLRRRCEKWNDMLLGYLQADFDVAEFAVEYERVAEYGSDYRAERHRTDQPILWPVVLASLRTAFCHGLSNDTPNADLNERITSSVLSCFQAEMFDSTGIIKSHWMDRMNDASVDTVGLVDMLLEEPSDLPAPGGSRISQTHRRRF